MEDEQAEDMLYPTKLAEVLGFQSLEHFEEFKENAIKGSLEAPQGFIWHLGACLSKADHKQAIKLIWAFKEDFDFAAMAWRMHEAKAKAEFEVNDG